MNYKYLITAIVFIVTTFSLPLLFIYTNNAYAVSNYDQLLNQTTNTLRLEGNGCQIDVPYAGLQVDLIKNDSLWSSTQYASLHTEIKEIWDSRTAFQVVQQNIPGNEYIQVIVTNDPNAFFDFGTYGSGYYYMMMNGSSPYKHALMSFETNTDCTNLQLGYTTLSTHSGTNTDANFVLATYDNYATTNMLLYAQGGNVIYPPSYEGPNAPGEPPSTIPIYPGMSVIVQDNGLDTDTSKVKLVFSDAWSDWLNENNIQSPYTPIFTITDMEDNIIVPDRCWGPTGCDWNNLELGTYKARLNVVFTDESVTDIYSFETSEAWFTVNNTSYTMLYNPTEDKYCTVRNGYEWNCSIPQPGDEPTPITGDPEVWTPEECSITDLGACTRNILHYIGEYLGINGPGITPGSSPFVSFDTNTFGLTSIITAPLGILNQIQSAQFICNTIQLPLPYIEENIQLPCLNQFYEDNLGSYYTMYQTIVNGIIAYYVIVGLLNMVKGFKDPESDRIEVIKL